MNKFILIIVLFLTGCQATQVSYVPNDLADLNYATEIIYQVIMEQPKKHSPKGLRINQKFISFGSLERESGRIYFDSIHHFTLYKKRDWYIVQLISKSGHVIKRFYTHNQNKAQKFIDAMNLYKSKANKF